MWFCKIIPEAGSNFKEANKTLIILWGREKHLRDLETISAYTEKVLIKMFAKKYPSRDNVAFT